MASLALEAAAVRLAAGAAAAGGGASGLQRLRPLLGEGAAVLPLAVASALTWLAVQHLTVPLLRLLAPGFLRDIGATAARRATRKGHSVVEASRAALADVGVRGTALAFSLLVSYGAARLILEPPPEFQTDPQFSSSPAAVFYCAVAAGYFMWDLPVSIYHRYGFGFICHAGCCLVVEFIALHPYNQCVMTFSHLFELSTPFLNVRCLLLAAGREASPLFTLCNVAFAIIFFAVRIVYGYRLSLGFVLRVVSDLTNGAPEVAARKGLAFVAVGWLSVGLCVALCALNMFWFGLIVRSVLGEKKRSIKSD